MRDRKFRAWDSRTKELIPILGFKYVGKKHIQLFYLDEDGDSTTCTCEKEFIDLMEYTGTKDKNDKEICEGDVLEWKFKNMLAGGEEVIRYTVHYYEPSACFKTKEHGSVNDTLLILTLSRDACVVGNIYENPEWLERGE